MVKREGNMDFNFNFKLYFIKGKLKFWDRESFQNIFKRKQELEADFKILNSKIIQGGM